MASALLLLETGAFLPDTLSISNKKMASRKETISGVMTMLR
jgi:hypothetical protein